jgi:hypothetical protein
VHLNTAVTGVEVLQHKSPVLNTLFSSIAEDRHNQASMNVDLLCGGCACGSSTCRVKVPWPAQCAQPMAGVLKQTVSSL